MQRYYFEISYNGTPYSGWQRQPKDKSVQEEIEKCFSKLNSNQPIEIVGCGRTDTGVHAHHYIFHVELPEYFNVENIVSKLNRMLPFSIAVQNYFPVSQDDHARFSATARTYRYFINFKKDPFKQDQSLYIPYAIDFDLMNEAAKLLIGTKDFTSFSKLHTDVKTNICSVTNAVWVKVDEENAYFEITANRFLRNMVRATVGTLLDVGKGSLEPSEINRILEEKNRSSASTSIAAHGLYLWKIEY
jgi:tRNA pseudouridine38-40 synthase